MTSLLHRRTLLKHSVVLSAAIWQFPSLAIAQTDTLSGPQAEQAPDADILSENEPKQLVSSEKQGQGIFETIAANDSLQVFAKCLKKSDIGKELDQNGPYTVFVSNDKAYKKVSFRRKLEVWTNIQLMRDILNFHIVEGRWRADDLINLKQLPTVHGADIDILATGTELNIAGATVVDADILASNGVIHVIDQVILPPKKDA